MNKLFFSMLVFVLFLGTAMAQTDGSTDIYFFHKVGCLACSTMEPYLDDFAARYPSVEIKKMNIHEGNNSVLLVALGEAHGLDMSVIHTPTIFVADKFYVGYSPQIVASIEQDIISCESGCADPLDILDGGGETKYALTLPLVTAAALADAVNPCAFAVLILLLTAILITGNRYKALRAGFAFTLAIYISYFLMGLGLFSAIQYAGMTDILYKVVGVLALVVGALNIKDFFSKGAGGFEMAVPKSWQPRMKGIIAKATTTPGAFVIGLIVSFFLLPCTSGPYIVILGMLAAQSTQATAIMWLIYYNILFVLPMIIITLIVFWGLTTPEKAQQWRLGKVRYMHLIAGIILFAMGVVLLSGIV